MKWKEDQEQKEMRGRRGEIGMSRKREASRQAGNEEKRPRAGGRSVKDDARDLFRMKERALDVSLRAIKRRFATDEAADHFREVLSCLHEGKRREEDKKKRRRTKLHVIARAMTQLFSGMILHF